MAPCLTGFSSRLITDTPPQNQSRKKDFLSVFEGVPQTDVPAGGTGAFGVICRYSEEQGWYEFNIYTDQSYELLFGQWLSPGIARYTPLSSGGSEKIKGDSNEIGLLCQGSTLTPFINGVQMRSWQDNKFGLKAGMIGISAASFESVPFTIAYDWLKVSEP